MTGLICKQVISETLKGDTDITKNSNTKRSQEGSSSPSEFEDLFGAAVRALEDRGLDFPNHARQTLLEALGEASAETLFVLLGSDAFHDPRLFAEQVCGLLGAGSRVVCKLVVTNAVQEIKGGGLLQAVKEFESNSTRFGAIPETEEKEKPILLHDHRIPDELEEYREKLSEQTDRLSTPTVTFW